MANQWHNEWQDWLSEEQSLENAQLVADRLRKNGWSKKSASAVIGNMRAESSVNPNMYEFGFTIADDRGYGLVQWTPRSKFVDWAKNNGYSQDEIEGEAQLDRLDYEAKEEIQYIPNGLQVQYGMGNKYNFSFKDYRSNKHDLSVDELTEAFMWNYERPEYNAALTSLQQERQPFANRAYNELNWNNKGSSNGGNSDGGSDDNNNPLDNLGDLFQDLTEEGIKVAKQMIKKIEEALQWDIHSIGTDKHFSNAYFQIMKTYNNTYKIKLRPDFLKMFGNVFDDLTGNDADASENNNDNNDNNNDSGNNGGNNKQFNTCYLHPERNFMQGFYPTLEIAHANNYPANARHMGYDMRMTSETLKAIGDGTVYKGWQMDNGFGWGNYVVLYPNNYDYCFLFAHLETISISNGQKVKKGDKLGVTGQTGVDQMGIPDNRHLHVELIKGNNANEGSNPSGKRVDPRDFILKYCNKVNDKNFKKDSSIYYS